MSPTHVQHIQKSLSIIFIEQRNQYSLNNKMIMNLARPSLVLFISIVIDKSIQKLQNSIFNKIWGDSRGKSL